MRVQSSKYLPHNTRPRITALAAMSLFLPMAVRADYVEVSQTSWVKAQPQSGATHKERVQPGTLLALAVEGEVNGYLKVVLPDGDFGWIHGQRVDRHSSPQLTTTVETLQ